MKIKLFLAFVLLFSTLFGFKYLRENGMVIPIKVSDLKKIKEQVEDVIMGGGEAIKSENNMDDTSGNAQIDGYKDTKEVIVGFSGEDKVLKKEREYTESEKPTTEDNKVVDIEAGAAEVIKNLSPEEKYLKERNIVVNTQVIPSYEYLKKCGVCHGKNGTGFNDGQELVGGSILHYDTESMYMKLLDFKEGELEGETMKKVVEPLSKIELRKITTEIMGFKK